MANSSAQPGIRRIGLVLVCLLVGHACDKVGPDFRHPDIKTASSWLDGQPHKSRSHEYRSWWEVFNDPALTRLIQRAYRQNLNVEMAAVRILEARAELGIAKGLLFPQVNQFRADGLYEQLSQQSPYYQGYSDYSFPYFQTGFDTAWEIDIWGRFRRGIESSAAQLAVKALDYDDVLVSLTAEVASAYVQIRSLQQRLALAKGNANLQKRSFEIADSQFRNGLSTELDMKQANALMQQTLAEIANLEIGLRQSTNALCLLLGMQPNHLTQELGTSTTIPSPQKAINPGIPADMLRRRPDIRREEFKAAEQSARIGIAKSDLLPRLSLAGSVFFASGSFDAVDAMNNLSPSGLAGKIGPTITWPILQFGRLKNNVRAQDAKYQALLIGYHQAVLNALREVEDAMIAFTKSQERVIKLTEGVNASQRAVDLALMQYRNGMEDYTRVLNSETLLVQQQDKLTASKGDVARNLVAIYKALGGGWEIREGQPILPTEIQKTMSERTDWGNLLTESPAELFEQEKNPDHSMKQDNFEEAM